MNLHNLFEDDNSSPGSGYAEQLADRIFKEAPELDATGKADEVLDYAFDLVVQELGRKKAHSLFAYDEDFDSDLVSAYAYLQRQGKDKEQVNEVDPRNFDSDEDYYAALKAKPKQRSSGTAAPTRVHPDDTDFMDPVERRLRADQARVKAAWAAHNAKKGVAEAGVGNRMSDMSVGSPKIVYKGGKAVGEIGLDHEASPGNGPYYMKHYETNTSYSGYDTKKEALAELKHVIDQMNEQALDEGSMGEIAAEYEDYKKLSPREFFNMYRITKQQWLAKYKSMLPQQGVAEADKKKEDEPEVRDVALQRAISRAKADFPTAGTGIEALAKDFMRSQDQDSKSFDQLRQAERKQDQMLGQISKIDQEQEQEIQDLETQNTTLAGRLQQLQSVNSELEKKLAAMSGRKADKKSNATNTSVAPAPASAKTEPISPATKKAAKPNAKVEPTTSKAIGQIANTLSPTPASPAFDRMAQDLQPRQKELGFDEPNVLEPTAKTGKRINTSKAVDAPYRDVSSKLAKKLAIDPEMKNKMYNTDALKNLAGQEEMPLENKDKTSKSEHPEAKYSDKYQDMVARVGQKAREQEKSKPVDIKDLARRLAAIEASRKDK